jgi:hypothetical protein
MFFMAARIYESTSVVELEHSAHNLIASWDTLAIAGCKFSMLAYLVLHKLTAKSQIKILSTFSGFTNNTVYLNFTNTSREKRGSLYL